MSTRASQTAAGRRVLARHFTFSGVLTAILLASCAQPPEKPLTTGERLDSAERPLNVLLISIDTLRADSLGCYGYSRPTSPGIDRFAERGILFRSAVSQSPWTRPAHLALFSGMFPTSRPDGRRQMLARVLRRSGYATAALTGGGQLDPRMGLGSGFKTYETFDWLRQPEQAVQWWRQRAHRSKFLFLHTYEVHDPYDHTELTAGLEAGRIGDQFDRAKWKALQREGGLTDSEKTYVRALYDGGIAYTDRKLEELFDQFAEAGLFEDTIVILTSDHGEQFWEHGTWRHGQVLFDHQLLVPLIVFLPPALRDRLGDEALPPGSEVTQQVALIDILPTLLDLLDLGQVESVVHGRSLRPLFEGKDPERVHAFAENTNIKAWERKAIRTERYKYVHSYPRRGGQGSPEMVELYDLNRDPEERFDLSETEPGLVARFEERLQAILAGSDPTFAPDQIPEDVDPELRRQLEALGYVAN